MLTGMLMHPCITRELARGRTRDDLAAAARYRLAIRRAALSATTRHAPRFLLRYSRAFAREPQTDIEHQLPLWLRLWS